MDSMDRWYRLESPSDDDYYTDEDRRMEQLLSRSRNLTCGCNSASEEPCEFCSGDYLCPDGCGYSANDCQCELEENDDE